MILHLLIAMVAGWLQRHQQQVITYLLAENRVLKAQLGGRRLRLTDTERRRLAVLAHPLGRQRLTELATLVTPETLLRLSLSRFLSGMRRLCYHAIVTGGMTHGRCTVHRAAVPPNGVSGLHEPDPRRVSAAGPAL